MIKHPQSAVLREAGLDNVDCDKCDNIGQIPWMDENRIMHCKECECMKRRRSIRRLENSGLKKMVQKYSFDNYQTPSKEYMKIKAKAMEKRTYARQSAAGCWMQTGIYDIFSGEQMRPN